MKDKLAGLLAFIFAQDQKENPMPVAGASNLINKIKQFLHVENAAHSEHKSIDSTKKEEN